MREISVRSSIDGSNEISLFHFPESKVKVPIVVGLHTWSAERTNQIAMMEPFVKNLGWALLLPEFRGQNLVSNPRATEACGSKLAKQDIVDAVDFIVREYAGKIDESNIFLLGGSGGGHMGCLMAGYKPELWKAVSSWCPITDLAKWHRENRNYSDHIAACCGGVPDDKNDARMKEYRYRSPISYIDDIARATIYISHGRWDKSVPFTHSYELYNTIYAKHPNANVYLNIFNGGHDLHYDQAFALFQKIARNTGNAKAELTK